MNSNQRSVEIASVMRQALEALERSVATCFDQHAHQQAMSRPDHFINQAITSLRQAIARVEHLEAEKQEPVAWIEHEWSGTGLRHLHFERREASLRDEVVNPIWTPLYTHPQPKAEKQEPYGWVSQHTTKGLYEWQFNKELSGVYKDTAISILPVYTHLPVYIHPQAKREWVWLTEQEETGILLSSKTVYSAMKFTEAKLKEKNT